MPASSSHSPAAPDPGFRKSAITAVVTIGVGLVAIALLNWAIDPEGRFGPTHIAYDPVDGFGAERLTARYQAAGAAILGSSLAHRANIADEATTAGMVLINLAGANNHSADQADLAELAIANGAKILYWEMLFNVMKPVADRRGQADYHPTWFDYLLYLTNGHTLAQSIQSIVHRRTSGLDDHLYAAYHRCDSCVYGLEAMKTQLPNILGPWKRNHPFDFVTPQRVRTNIEATILPVIRNHPKVRFYVYFPPISALGSVAIDRALQSRGTCLSEIEDTVYSLLADQPNVIIADFQTDEDWVTRWDNYSDLIHYRPEINTQIIERFAQGRYAYTPDRTQRLQKLIERFSPTFDRLIAANAH